jgi:hypothetical protein
MSRWTRVLVMAAMVAVAAQTMQGNAAAQEKQEPKKDAPAAAVSVAGKWNMSLDGPQGPMTIAMTLVQDGPKVTGTLSSQMGDTTLEGQFADGTLSFSISFDGGGGSMQLGFVAKLKDPNSLEGMMSGPMGDIPWVAVRVKD